LENPYPCSSDIIADLLTHPASILSKVHNFNMGIPHGPYLQYLAGELDHMLPAAGGKPTLVSNLLSNCQANHTVVRKRVSSLFLNTQQPKGGRATKNNNKKSAATLKPPTPTPKRQRMSPTVVPAGLSLVPTLNQLLACTTSVSSVVTLPPPLPATIVARPMETTDPPSYFETELEQRFATFKLAEQQSIDSLGPPQVTVFCDMGMPSQCKKILHCAPMELYLIDGLRFYEHKFDYGDGGRVANNIATLTVSSNADYVSPGFSVLRRTNQIISKNLASVRIDLATIIIFTLKHGQSSALRDSVGGGKRIDCGCAGQAYTLSQDDLSWALATSVGFGIFGEHIQSQKERDTFLASLGCIQDGIQDCLDDVQRLLGIPLLLIVSLESKPMPAKSEINSWPAVFVMSG
jgi:hypothetical protein